MSLLANEVYANSSTPLWLSANNPVVSGTITAGSFTTTPGGNVRIIDASGNIAMGLTSQSGNTYLQSGGPLKLGQPGQVTTNTTFTPSAPGANLDVLTVGGQINGGGITPVPSIVTTASISVGSSGAAITITPTTALVNGGVYDIQVSGYWSVPAGVTTPDPTDQIILTLQTGTAVSPGLLRFQYSDVQYPGFASDVWTSTSFHPIHIRARLPSNGANLTLAATFTATGTYPGSAVDLVVSDLTVVRVA